MVAAVAGAVLGAGMLADASQARADGAFPNSQAVLLAAERPAQIIVAATFGLVISEDNGATWSYACETDASRNGRQYVQGAAPDRRLYAVADPGAAASADDGCTWTLGGGAIDGAPVLDLFPDPAAPLGVLAVAAANGAPASVYRSADGGLTFSGPAFSPPPAGAVSGVEVAASDPRTLYVSFYERPGNRPRLARSRDGGATFTTIDLEPSLGELAPSLATVDPDDADVVFLRLQGTTPDLMHSMEQIAISRDGGVTWATPVTLVDGVLTAFLRRRDGSIVIAGVRYGVASDTPVGFQSSDGGETFQDWPLAIGIVGLGERGGTLFAATDSARDGVALVSSDDGGVTFTPRLRFADVAGVRPCARGHCTDDCVFQAERMLFPLERCDLSPDAGGDGLGNAGGGCGCALGGSRVPALLVAAALLLVFRRRAIVPPPPEVNSRKGSSRRWGRFRRARTACTRRAGRRSRWRAR